MDEYIKRFMETLDEDERGKDIEVQVFTNGEHTIVANDEDGYYVVAGAAKVTILNAHGGTKVLVVDRGQLKISGYYGHPDVSAEDQGFVDIAFGGRVSAKGNAHVNAAWGVFLYITENASSRSVGCYVKMWGNSTGEIFDCHEADIYDNAEAHINGVGHIRCRDNSKSYVTDCTWVDAFDDSELVASGASKVSAWRRAKVDARDSTTVYLYHDAECEPSEVGNVAVIKRKGNPWDYDRR